jgi:hypothetical protein
MTAVEHDRPRETPADRPTESRLAIRPRRRAHAPLALLAPLAVVIALLSVVGALGVSPLTVFSGGASSAAGQSPTAILGRTITLNVSAGSSGYPGPLVNLSGFTPGGQAVVDVFNASVPSYNIWSDPFYYLNSTGAVSTAFTPAPVGSNGGYVFSANETGAPNVTADYSITGGGPSFSVAPSSGSAGSTVALTGSGFSASGYVSVYLGDSSSFSFLTTGQTDLLGDLSFSVTVPSVATGNYVLFVEDSLDYYGATAFSVTSSPASMRLSPSSGTVGTSVTANLTGFTQPATVMFDSAPVCSATPIYNSPNLECSFLVPSSALGVATVTAYDTSGDSASASFTVLGLPSGVAYPVYFLGYFPTGRASTLKAPYEIAGMRAFVLQNISVDRGSSSPSVFFNSTLNFSLDATHLVAGLTSISKLYLLGYNVSSPGVANLFQRLEFSSYSASGVWTGAGGAYPILHLDVQATKVAALNLVASPSPVRGFPAYLLSAAPLSRASEGGCTSQIGTTVGAPLENWSWNGAGSLNASFSCGGGGAGWLIDAYSGAHLSWVAMTAYASANPSSYFLVLNFSDAVVVEATEVAHEGAFPNVYVSIVAARYSVHSY